ncbi:hypothetical protein [Streptomyces sp. NPDC051684]|uniref:hypothetical protein n=1 Tax=Streptomyces sp. NPDC051684 TaxID=3365670 RepID=UPI0037A35B1E
MQTVFGIATGIFFLTWMLYMQLGLSLASVVFFNVVEDKFAQGVGNAAFVDGFRSALVWVAGVLVGLFALMFALPKASGGSGEIVSGDVEDVEVEDVAVERELV